ncbi:hypothetical protein QFC20_003000 [Naganishia adeliensis]|uniref:Uncharacterized protein n=1 Tax=Naganishia adeliensis TaxID=92952 RepID=A0ACC2WFH2_9TREE|nr:hypothetical protein QFC20_003000 [Naganishia adeliensis]
MRKAGVTPVTVWDVKGDRPWKRKEHMRRDAIRQLAMSRLLHEDRRQDRLGRLFEALKDVPQPEDPTSKGPVTEAVQAERAPRTEVEDASREPNVGATEQQQKDTSSDRLVEELQGLIQEVQLSSRPGSRRGRKEAVEAPEESEGELSLPEEINTQPLEDSEDTTLPLTDEQDPTEESEIKRALVEPDATYTESPRQMTLTAEEELQLQDLVQAVSSRDDTQSRVAELGKGLTDLRDRSQLVSRTYRRGHSIPSKWELEECQQLMEVMGVPVILAHPPFEAEGLASAMALAGEADFVGTEDTDVLGYEAPLLRNIASSNKPIEIVDGKALRTAYGLSREQFVDFLVLTGTDASSRIPGVGPVKALKLIQKFGTIEAILENDERLRERAGADYQDEVDAARQLFNILPPLPSAQELQPRTIPDDTIRDFMKSEHGVLLPATGFQLRPTSSVEEDPQTSYRISQDADLAHEAFLQQTCIQDID